MANIADTAGIFTGAVLEAFNQMEFLVNRDGDTTYAQRVMIESMQKVISTQGLTSASTAGAATKQRGK